ncbi:MFS general substrate transporter [Dacryopinax primogenitus]|uniref:MFS general substrate transporter n=1 Tax=Dacryopinax primogenitus (strain DJM 731) TaxID=1858805 RepID=M5FP98_DACPD|nr:MFS general substrate transporter [Dacryopinax primogenitus]EJT98360.1 MFS general substrate transporter [Dacryopinax primogenitus]
MLDQRRRRALQDLDEATFSKFHVRTVLVAGAGFFTDAYDIFAISVGAVMLGLVYNNGLTSLGAAADLGLKVACPIGNLFGQTLFGWMADVYGRKKMYGIELVIIITATLVQAMAAQGPNTSVTITGVLVFWRFVMGVGIGGDYPLSAIITSEFAATRIRGRMMTAVFAAQGFGTLSATVVAIICVAAFRDRILSTGAAGVDPCWRLLIGLGCVPAVFALYFRLSIPESPRFTMDVERNVTAAARESERFMRTAGYRDERDVFSTALKAEAPRMSWHDFRTYFGQWRNGRILLGTAYSWFALDIAFYGLGFNSSLLLNKIGYGASGSCEVGQLPTDLANQCMYNTVWSISLGSIILAAAGLIPGFIASFLLVDVVGRRPLQLAGFALMTCILCAMGFGYWELQHESTWFVVLFCLANFMANAGPNTTTFVIPGEVFPTRYRSTAHGISAASGKLGAVIAQIIFSRLQDLGGPSGSGNWIGHILEIFAFFMLTGVFSTLLLPETKRKSLEELSNEVQENFIYDLHEVQFPEGAILHGQPEAHMHMHINGHTLLQSSANGHPLHPREVTFADQEYRDEPLYPEPETEPEPEAGADQGATSRTRAGVVAYAR